MIETILKNSGYAGIVGILLLTGFGLPVPEDIPLLIAGWLCARDICELWIMIPLTFVSIVGADVIVFELGRRWGHHVPKLPLLRRYLTERRLKKAEIAYHRHGGKTLFLARFMPGLRTPMYFSAGTFGISIWKFLFFDGLAALISVPLLVLAGWWFADMLDQVKETSHQVQWVVAGVVAALVLVFVIWKWRSYQREKAAEAAHEPPSDPLAFIHEDDDQE
ncbi:MAG: DedA family protein [Phycisphaeraceae bacterium]|nr:DedA family protein [Phycisphaeraceae bacterium]